MRRPPDPFTFVTYTLLAVPPEPPDGAIGPPLSHGAVR